MRTPKILTGAVFNWKEAEKYANRAVGPDGEPNWMAASFADPGVTKCPKCEAFYWNEGDTVECLDCGTQWETSNGKWKRARAEKAAR